MFITVSNSLELGVDVDAGAATYLPVRRAYLFLFIINVIIYYRPEILDDFPALFIPRLIRDSPDNRFVAGDIAVLEFRMGDG